MSEEAFLMIWMACVVACAFGYLDFYFKKHEKNSCDEHQMKIHLMELQAQLETEREIRKEKWKADLREFESNERKRKNAIFYADMKWNSEMNIWLWYRERYKELTPEQKLSYIPEWVEYKILFKRTAYDEPMPFECFVCNQLILKS